MITSAPTVIGSEPTMAPDTAAQHPCGAFGNDGVDPNTCMCRCARCWDDAPPRGIGRCLCPDCESPHHDHRAVVAADPTIPAALGVDPWDETSVTVPRGLLALLLNAAGKADEAGLLGECPSDPCPYCTALVDIHEAVYLSA